MPDFTSLGSRLAYARTAAGLRQSDVAQALGLSHSIQVSKWENDLHAPAARTLDRLADLYGVAVAWLLNGNDYPLDNTAALRGTLRERPQVAYPLVRGVAQLVRDFERELIRMGASDLEVDFVVSVLRSPESSRLFQAAGGALLDQEAETEARLLMDALRMWVQTRIARRTIAAPEPIKPKDLPAAMEKRRAELDAAGGDVKPSRRTK